MTSCLDNIAEKGRSASGPPSSGPPRSTISHRSEGIAKDFPQFPALSSGVLAILSAASGHKPMHHWHSTS